MKQRYKNISKYILALFFFISVFGYFDIDVHASSQIAYFTEADAVTYVGQDSTDSWGDDYAIYKNKEINTSKYVVYSNAVRTRDGNSYDLVLYPFNFNTNANIYIKMRTNKIIPGFSGGDKGFQGVKACITKHGDIKSTINMDALIGISDLDQSESVVFTSDHKIIHKGSDIETIIIQNSDSNYPAGTRYRGKSDTKQDKNMYDENCVIVQLNIPSTGIIFYYGSPGFRGASIAFDEILDYFGDDIFPEYNIVFNANGGSGSVPSTITKEGTDTSVVMGDISSTVPTRSGYVFKGWSASSSWNSKRIAYSSSSGGSAASDGTSAKNNKQLMVLCYILRKYRRRFI